VASAAAENSGFSAPREMVWKIPFRRERGRPIHRSGGSVNEIHVQRRSLAAMLGVRGNADFHALLFREALAPYLEEAKRAGREPGSVLAVGAGSREARALAELPFERVVLSSVAEPDAAVQEVVARHPRIAFELANAESLPWAPRSFDLVLCKEALHHLARPVQGLYEMLRVCRRRAVFIEPWECALGSLLDRLGLTTRFERGQVANLGARDNHVYRWNRESLAALLASYYLDSGASCAVRVGWLSNRVVTPRTGPLRRALVFGGWLASHLPGAAGNLATVAIDPGSDLPPDPRPID